MLGLAHLTRFTIDNLYGNYVTNGKWDESKYKQYMVARAGLPLYFAYADYEIGKQANSWYFDRYGKSWGDVIQPWNLPGYSRQESAVRHTYNYVSDNIKRLYK